MHDSSGTNSDQLDIDQPKRTAVDQVVARYDATIQLVVVREP